MNTTERDIPSEIYLKIFENLDFKTLLGCMRLSKTFLDLITNSATLQFIIELGIANQVPGEPSSSAEGLEQLRRHQRAWEKASWYRSFSLPQNRGPWVLYGGILANADDSNTIHFTRLPSDLRGIPREEWKVSLPQDLYTLHYTFYDIAIDPSQDLLVTVGVTLITGHTVACEIEVRLFGLKTGSRHPLSPQNVPLTLSLDTNSTPSCSVQVVGDRIVMLLAQSARVQDDGDNELVVLDWKKGTQVAHIHGGLLSCSPLGPTTVLAVTWNEEGAPLFATIDFDKAGPKKTHLRDATAVQYFGLPALGPTIRFRSAQVQSDPCPPSQPRNGPRVPFSEDVRNKIYVLTYRYSERDDLGVEHTYALQQFVPGKHFTLDSPPRKPAYIHPWETWGAGNKSLWRRPDFIPSRTWGCYVYAQRYIALVDPNETAVYALFDFNEHMYKRSCFQASNPSQSHLAIEEWDLTPSLYSFDSDSPFASSVPTSLPGRCRYAVLEDPHEQACWPMISEDNLILVDVQKGFYHIYLPSKESP